jgi:N-methylhydantoinase A
MAHRIGIDIGGTFTDFVLLDDATGNLATFKQLTTPEDPSKAVLDGVATVLADNQVAFADVSAIAHGTTLVTNAIIERRGAPTGMLVTAGMKDILDIARETRYDLFDLRLRFPQPLVPRRMRREVAERVRFDGTVIKALDSEEVRASVRSLIDTYAIQSLAVCLLHSYAEPEHENRIVASVRKEFPDLYVSSSADVFPFMREYDRWTTTTMNAYVQPLMDLYIGKLEAGLEALGFRGRFHIMTSSGGTVTPETARRYPVRLLESGPAAGALMSAFHGRMLKLGQLLSFDMGGTTAKGALVRDGQPLKKYEMEVARVHEFKAGSGLPAKVPTIDMIEIGSGGGSIAHVDDRGVIAVGPHSAGASPGPACYGQGGDRPSLTDANLILGYLDPGFFLGGRMSLDGAAAAGVIMADIGSPLGLDLTRAAWGIHEIINEDVARAFRVHASERAFDYRISSMTAFGGSGPMHAARIARKLRVPRVVLPFAAGVISALGLMISPLSFEVVRSRRVGLEALTDALFDSEFQPLIEEVSALLERSGVEQTSITLTRKLDMRYEGQGYEIEVLVPRSGRVKDIPNAFEAAYKALFSSITLEERTEIVNWKVEGRGPQPSAGIRYRFKDVRTDGDALKGHRKAYFPEAGGYVDCPVYDRYRMRPGTRAKGPALVEERESTCVIGVDDSFEIDTHYNIIVDIQDERP